MMNVTPTQRFVPSVVNTTATVVPFHKGQAASLMFQRNYFRRRDQQSHAAALKDDSTGPTSVFSQASCKGYKAHHRRRIDAEDPDDWWGASTSYSSVKGARPQKSNVRPFAAHHHDDDRKHEHHESDYWASHHTRYDGGGSSHTAYYYHEYHYMHYAKAKRHRRESFEMSTPQSALELASKSFERALSVVAREQEHLQKSILDEMENIVVQEIQNVATCCRSDIVVFAQAVGVLSREDIYSHPGHESLKKKARKSIVITFHPDKVNHLKESGKRLSYLLGHSVLQALSTMPYR